MKILYRNTDDKRVADINNLIAEKYPKLLKEESPDIIMVAGGDGAMLHAIQEHKDKNVPFFGKARGTFNFLMNHFDNNQMVIEGLLNDIYNLYIVETDSIAVRINRKLIGEAVNEVLIGNSINGYHEFAITTQDLSFDNFVIRGCGLCISTPLGSTGYNFNNAGAILPVGRKLWIITGIVCNQFINDLINIQNLTITASKGKVFLDGIESAKITKETNIELSVGKVVRLAFLNKQQFLHQRVELLHRFRK